MGYKCDSTAVTMTADSRSQCLTMCGAESLNLGYVVGFCCAFKVSDGECTISADGETSNSAGNSGWMSIRGWIGEGDKLGSSGFDGISPPPPA